MSTYAQVQDIEAGWNRPFSVPEIGVIQTLLDRAENLIRLHVDIEARITSELTTPGNVKTALVQIVERKLRNPGGYRQQATGPFSATLDRSVASGRLEITRDERRLLGMISGAGSVGVADSALSVLVIAPSEEWPA